MPALPGVRLGFALPQVFLDGAPDIAAIRAVAASSEGAGIDSLWVQAQLTGQAAVLDPVTLLAYASAVTTRISLGTSVLPVPDHNPLQLAKQIASLDQLSGGRTIIGLGIGAPTTHTRAGGIPRDHVIDRLMESVAIMKALWSDESVSLGGRFWQLENLAMRPFPLQRPHPPIWLGGSTDAALRRAAHHGDMWMGSGIHTVSEFSSQVEKLRSLRAESAAVSRPFLIAKRVYVVMNDDSRKAECVVRSHFDRYSGHGEKAVRAAVFGPAEEIIRSLSEVAAAGAELIVLNPLHEFVSQHEMLLGALRA
jgi:probable F420-dependent oxidoreductase